MIPTTHHFVALCALATAAGCSGSTTGAPGGQVAGSGGSTPLVGGYGGRRDMGPYMTGGASSAVGGTGPNVGGAGANNTGGTSGTAGSACGGPAPAAGGGGNSPMRYAAAQCYVSDLSEGEPSCLPANEVRERLSDYIQSIGFVVEFVIDFEESIPLPSSCEPLVECCSQQQESYRQQQCFDWLDGARDGVSIDGCPVQSANLLEYFECSPGEGGAPGTVGEGGAAGAPEGPSRALCCYQACGYSHAI